MVRDIVRCVRYDNIIRLGRLAVLGPSATILILRDDTFQLIQLRTRPLELERYVGFDRCAENTAA